MDDYTTFEDVDPPAGTTFVYGRSDDLIELLGSMYDELDVWDSDEDHVIEMTFSSGAIITMAYAKHGVWRINTISHPECIDIFYKAPDDDDDRYSDGAFVNGVLIKATFKDDIIYDRPV